MRFRCRFLPSTVATAVLMKARAQCKLDPQSPEIFDPRTNMEQVKECLLYMHNLQQTTTPPEAIKPQ